MSKRCTAAEALEAFAYWLGYYEKASKTYATFRDKKYFEADKGDRNYTYMGYHCGVQGGAWCAMMVSTAIDEACGGGIIDARAVMHGLWPYTSCDQLYDAAPSNMRGRRDAWTPRPGDVIVFGRNIREHTGMVYAVDGTYVYTYEGNSSNMCRKRSYLRTSDYIWGYVRPKYADAALPEIPGELYGPVVYEDIWLHLLSKGCAGPEVKALQRLLYAMELRGEDGKALSIDGDFGRNTAHATKAAQRLLNLEDDGKAGRDTWKALLTRAG